MKKIMLSLSIAVLLLMSSCGRSSSGGIEDVVEAFYTFGYDYRKITTVYEKDEVIAETIVEGQLFQDPYKEYVKIVESTEEGMWTEVYCDGGGGYILTDGAVQKTPMKLPKPYGYGEDLTFGEGTEGTLEGKAVLIYEARYQVDVGKPYGIKDKLKATVKQQYFVDTASDTIVKITTDLSEQNRMNAAAIHMSVNQLSYEDAVKAAGEEEPYQEKEELYIFHFGQPTEFEMPKGE